MTVTMADGKTFFSQVDYPKGSIQNPMSDDEIRAKFTSLAEPVVGLPRVKRIIELAGNIENCADVGELMKLTRGKK